MNSMLPWVYTVIKMWQGHLVTHSLPLFWFHHILMSSVIYYSNRTDPPVKVTICFLSDHEKKQILFMVTSSIHLLSSIS